MFVVAGVELDEHRVGAGGEVAFHHLADVFQLGHGVLVHGAFFQLHADIGACAVAQALGVHMIAGTDDDAQVDQSLHALMDGCTRNSAFGCYVFERDTGILGNNLQDAAV